MACDQQQPPGRNDVLCGHTFLRGQPRQQSGARFGAVPLYQLGHVLVHLRRGLGGGRLLSGSRIELGDDCLGPRMEARLVLVRHPELLADYRDRQRVGEVVHEVDLVLALHTVDEPTGGAHHVGSHRFGLLEVARGQTPEAIMRGGIHSDEAAGPFAACTGACTAANPPDADPRIVHQGPDLAVGADDVAAVRRAEDRRLTQFRVQRVRVGTVGVVENLGQQARLTGRGLLGHLRPRAQA
jgi:hypothetical protein